MRTRCALVLAVSVGCSAASSRSNPLLVEPSVVTRADVQRKITRAPYNYFRFVNIEFAQEVCRRFAPVIDTLPVVNLHGDAHLQQFAVTAHSAGLADFDDSVTGPPVLDLVRFGVSIRLALEQRGWQADTQRALARFLASYRAALDGDAAPPEPAVVARLRKRFTASNAEFVVWAEQQMEPVPEPRRSEAEQGYARYTELMLRLYPQLTAAFFELKVWGALQSGGIGSTRGARLLARIEGPTSDANDDIILEAKEVRDLTSVPCMQTQRGDALRVIVGTATFGRRTDPYLAVIPRGIGEANTNPPWWIQSWSASYGEVDIDDTFETVDELLEVVDASAAQLAAGHASRLPAPYSDQLGQVLRAALDEHTARILQVVDELSATTTDAFNRFRAS